MRLADLHPKWVGAGGEGITDAAGNPKPARHGIGVTFDCPCGCDEPVYVAFSNPIDGGLAVIDPGESVWARYGDTFETLTLSPSLQRTDGCRWHGHVTNGEVTPAQ